MFAKNVGPSQSHKFSDSNVQNLTVNSVLQLYTVLQLLSDLRYSFMNSEALFNPVPILSFKCCNTLERPHRPENCALLCPFFVGSVCWNMLKMPKSTYVEDISEDGL